MLTWDFSAPQLFHIRESLSESRGCDVCGWGRKMKFWVRTLYVATLGCHSCQILFRMVMLSHIGTAACSTSVGNSGCESSTLVHSLSFAL